MKGRGRAELSMAFGMPSYIESRLRGPYVFLVNSSIQFLISLVYIGILWFYSGGALFYGGDSAGIYTPLDLFLNSRTTSIVSVMALSLTGGDVTTAFYISQFVSAFTLQIAIAYLCRQLFRGFIGDRALFWVGILAGLGFIFSPAAVVSIQFLSFVNNVTVEDAAFATFLAEIIYLWRTVKDGTRYPYKHGAFLGLSFGLAVPAFPTWARVLVVGSLLLIYFALIEIRMLFKRINVRSFFRGLLIGLIATVGLLGTSAWRWFIPLIESTGSLLASASSGATNFANVPVYVGTFNTLAQVFRLVGYWGFPALPYCSMFSPGPNVECNASLPGNTFVTLGSFLLPIFALVIPLLFARGKLKGIVVPVVLLMAIMVFWEKNTNPPLQGVSQFLLSIVPYGNTFIPTYFLTRHVLDILYAVMMAFGVERVYSLLKRVPLSTPEGRTPYVQVSSVVLSILLLSPGAVPSLSGQVLVNSINGQNFTGFHIPGSYYDARNYLYGVTGDVLIVPCTATYLSETWGYFGTSAVYPYFFAPVTTVTIDNFGGVEATSAQQQQYFNLSEPVLIPSNTSQSEIYALHSIQITGTNFTITSQNITLAAKTNAYVVMSFNFVAPLNLSQFSFIKVLMGYTSPSAAQGLLNASTYRVSMSTGNGGNLTLQVGKATNSFALVGGSNVSATVPIQNGVLVTTPSNPSLGNVTSLAFSINGTIPKLTMGYPVLTGYTGYAFSPSWISNIDSYGVRYLFYDTYLLSPCTPQPTNYFSTVIQTANETGFGTQVFSESGLSIFKLNF